MPLAEVEPEVEGEDEVDSEDDSDEMTVTESEPSGVDSFDDEEEVPAPISYEGIPSWEEAISHLQRRPRDSRPRGEGAPRGRGGPHRR